MKDWYTKEVDDRISHMFEALRLFRFQPSARPRPFITISREYGCEAFEIASDLIERLNQHGRPDPPWSVYDRLLVEKVSDDMKIADDLISSMSTEHRHAFEQFLSTMVLKIPSQDDIFRRTARVVKSIAWHGNSIIIGRGGAFLCRDMPGGLHVQIVAPFEWRLKTLLKKHKKKSKEAVRKWLQGKDKERIRFYEKHLDCDIRISRDFDLVFNNNKFGASEITEFILYAMSIRK